MPGIFIGPIELANVGEIKIGSVSIQEVFIGAVKVFPSGAPLPAPIYDWNSEIAQDLPPTSVFARAGERQVLTTTDGTFWYQDAKSGELPLSRLRRIENLFLGSTAADFSMQSGATRSGDEVTFPGASDAERAEQNVAGLAATQPVGFRADMRDTTSSEVIALELSGPGGNLTEDITITTTLQTFYINSDESASIYRIRNNGTGPLVATTFELFEGQAVILQTGTSPPGEFVDPIVEHGNIGVDGVKYFNTDNGNSVDAGGVVTEAAGTEISGGGYSPNPASTNRLLRSNDMTDAAWTASGAATPTDLGVTDIGKNSTQVSGLGALGVDDILQSVSSFTASGPVAPSFLLRRVSATGTLRIVNAVGGASNGEWNVDLSLIGSGWVRLEPGASVAGFTETTAWVADGSGNAGITYHAGAGGPLNVDLASNKLENSFFATAPITTLGNTISSLADVLSTGIVIPSEFGVLLDVTLPNAIGSGNTISLLGPDATAVPILSVDAGFNIVMDDGGTPTTVGTSSAGTRMRVSYGRDAGGRAASLNGATAVSGDAPSAGHEGDNFQIGASNGANQSRCIHHVTTLYNVKPTDAQLEALSS